MRVSVSVSVEARNLDAEADAALEAARSMPPGPEKVDALKKAGLLRKAADAKGMYSRRVADDQSKRRLRPHRDP